MMFGWFRWLGGGSQATAFESQHGDVVSRILRAAYTQAVAADVPITHFFEYIVAAETDTKLLTEDVEFGLLIRARQHGLDFVRADGNQVIFTRLY